MRSRATIAISVAVFLALTFAFGWRGLRSARQAEASLAALTAQLAQMDQDVQHERDRVAERRRKAEVLKAELNGTHVAEESPESSAAKPRASANDAETLMVSDPKLRALYLSSFRLNFSLGHGSMYLALGLTPSQIRTIEELATVRADDLVTIRAAALVQRLAPSDPGLAALQKQNTDQFYAAVATEVSEVAAQQTRQFDRMEAAREIAVQANSLSPSGPQNLTGAQIAQLTQLLANTSATYQRGGNADKDSIDWDSVYNQADAFLSGTLSGPQIQNFKSTVELFKFVKIRNQIHSQPQTGAP